MRQVVLTKIAEKQLNEIIEYIKLSFGEGAKLKFINRLKKYIEIISKNPKSFPKSQKIEGIHKCVISKQTSLFYKFNEKRITILTAFDNRQNPEKLLKYLKSNRT